MSALETILDKKITSSPRLIGNLTYFTRQEKLWLL
jgi:hypothetical protein